MRLMSLRRHSDVLPGIFGRHLWYLVLLICLLRNFRFIKNENGSEHLRKQSSEVSYKNGVLNNFAISIGKHLCRSLFLIILHAFRPPILLKRDSNTGVFPWIVWNFYKHLFRRSSVNAWFHIYTTCYVIWSDLVAITGVS